MESVQFDRLRSHTIHTREGDEQFLDRDRSRDEVLFDHVSHQRLQGRPIGRSSWAKTEPSCGATL
jgi:hypothetical protein